MKKRLIASVTCLALLLTMLLGSTLAWFTDTTDVAHNTMVVGNVEIEQYEQYRDNGQLNLWNPDYKPQLVGAVIYNGGNVVMPEDAARYTEAIDIDENGFWKNTGDDGVIVKNAIDKVVTIKNVGNTDAYVRTVFAFEMMWDGVNWVNPITTGAVVLNVNEIDGQKMQFGDDPIIIYRYAITQTVNGEDLVSYAYAAENYGQADAAFVRGV